MAAPRSCHEFEISEPTYCRVATNNLKLENFNDPMKALWTLMSSKIMHSKILSEFKILHVLLYKRTGQLRKAKCFQLLKRVEACLKRCEKFDKVFSLMASLHDDLTSANADVAAGKPVVYLPPQQTWSYLLYLQTVYVKLLEATISYCVCAFEHLSNQFALGWLIPSMVLYMTVTARIWLLSGRLSEKLVKFYNELYPYKACFERTNSTWQEPELPSNICCTFSMNASKDMERFSKESLNDTAKPEIVTGKQSEHELCQDEDFGVPVTIQRTKEETGRFGENKRKNYEEECKGTSKPPVFKKKKTKRTKQTSSSNLQADVQREPKKKKTARDGSEHKEQNNNVEDVGVVKEAKKRKALITSEERGSTQKKRNKESGISFKAEKGPANAMDTKTTKKKKKAKIPAETQGGLEVEKNRSLSQADQQSALQSAKGKKLKKKRKKKNKLNKK
ncbi:unnamed protein product [Lymnaea stagnalis]|uniref:Nucleolus and neural progenitor protein-like N-terminal domain-containing protein n=1 Tax=Lymnaea stagnalis TaxID=6523 RepID=A0AAV2HTK7_LYMST